MTLCNLDGRLLQLSEARIDPLDRGFLFGDAVYDVARVAGGRPLDLTAHLDRLGRGLRRVGIPEPPGIAAACHDLIAAEHLVEGSLYVQVSRGPAPRGHAPPADPRPTLLVLIDRRPLPAHGSRPHAAVIVPDPRWRHCDVKTTSLMATVLAYVEGGGADEVVFAGPDGELREGGHTSLFVRRRGRLETHPLDGRVLPGVTRAILLGLAAGDGMPAVERAPRRDEIEEWNEAFVCGTRTGVQPLVALDGRPVAKGEPGEWTRRLAEALAAREGTARG